MLLIHRAERSDTLAAELAEVLRGPSADPFRPEIVAVPSRGVERWLAQRLSHTLGAAVGGDGVCANVVFPSYTRYLDEVVAEADENYRESVERWEPERAVWPLLGVIDRCAPHEPWCRVLATHLGLGEADEAADNGRRLPVAAKLARLFDRYGRSRPHMLRAWQAGRDEQGDGAPLPTDLLWQAELWRRLRAEIGVAAPAELLEEACRQVSAPSDMSIFGPTRIAPARVTVLAALARSCDIHLWLHHPSPALWAAVAAQAERPGRRRDHTVSVRNPVLASMARDVRELQQLLATVPHTDRHHPVAARPATLLGRLQDDLAHDRLPAMGGPPDDSFQVHAAHGAARQVEVVREVVLGLLAADPTLEPRDVLIMCPDVETFAPLVAASFGMADEPGGHPAAQLRVKLADRSARQTNPLLSLLSQLLELAAGRVTATQFLDLAGSAPVRSKFGFDDDAVERIRTWAVAANARWGLDPEHRRAFKLGHLGNGTWRRAIDRLLLGVAMEDAAAWVGDTLPLDDVDSGDIEVAGRLAELLDRVDTFVRRCGRRHTVREWTALLADAIAELAEPQHAWQALQLRLELEDLASSAEGAAVELGLTDVSALLHDRLAGRPTRASFRTGTLTVCTLIPMRSVPHRVVCLIGLDDAAFPRQATPDGDDVLARDPRAGERDPRSEDRQLFLDAVCAATEHLVITYTGADPRTGAEVPPSVPLGELLDALGPLREQVITRHPLQPFDNRNFSPGSLGRPGAFSFDPLGLAGARAAARPRVAVPPLVGAPLPAKLDDVMVDDLVRFLHHPARGFLRQRLLIGTYEDNNDPSDAVPIELDGLQGWSIGERVLRACLAGVPRAVAARLEELRGDLPPGILGADVLRQLRMRVDALLNASAAERQQPAAAVDINVTLPGGRTLTGTVTGVRGDVILAVNYSQLSAKQRLASWVRYLAVVASTGQDHRAITVARWKDDAARSEFGGVPPELAIRLLGVLVAVRDAGLCEPLPIALKTSAGYAERRRGVAAADALPIAREKWESDRYAPERAEREHVLIYGADAPFDRLLADAPAPGEEWPDEPRRFGALAQCIWAPLLAAETSAR